jgi:hypothetical protein
MRILIGLAAVWLVAAAGSAVTGWGQDPLVVLEKLAAAERSIDVDAALTLFADDAAIVNVTGRKFSGSELKSFVEETIWRGDGFAIESPRAQGDAAAWTQAVTANFYESLGVGPVTFAFKAAFEKGKIKCIIAYFPSTEITRIEKACRAQDPNPLIYGGECSAFVRNARTHTHFVSEHPRRDDATICPQVSFPHGRPVSWRP